MITFIYVILVFLILRFSVTLFNFLSNPKLGKYGKHFTDKVSVLINAGADRAGLLTLLTSIQQQDYQYIEVLISCTALSENEKIAEHFCSSDDRFLMIGENSRRIIAAENASGDYLLFLDTNTSIKPGFINSLIYRTKVFDLAVLSIIPSETPKTITQHLLLPLNDFVLLNLVPLRLVRLFSSPAFLTSSDKCIFLSAPAYHKYEWPIGKEIIKAVKQEGFKAETLLGDRLICVSSPAHISNLTKVNLLNTSGKNILLIFGNNSFAAILYLILVVAGPIIMIANAEYELLILPVGLIFLTRIMISFLVKQNPLINVLLHPLQMIALCIALSNTIFMRILTILRQ